MNKRITVAVLIVLSFSIGSALGWWLQGNRAGKYRASLMVAGESEVAGLCANALWAAGDGSTATLQKLLERRMTSAVNEAVKRTGTASPPDIAVPDLIDGVNRARRYAVAKGLPEVVAKCDRLLEFLTKNIVRA
jgi:hypothetical protein